VRHAGCTLHDDARDSQERALYQIVESYFALQQRISGIELRLMLA
jgi:hypothetical protein